MLTNPRKLWNTSAELITQGAGSTSRNIPKGVSQVAVFSDVQVILEVLNGATPTAAYIVNSPTPISFSLGIQATSVKITATSSTNTYLNFFILNPNLRVGSFGDTPPEPPPPAESSFLDYGLGNIDIGDASLLQVV